jgi:hypothetical protein
VRRITEQVGVHGVDSKVPAHSIITEALGNFDWTIGLGGSNARPHNPIHRPKVI